MTQLHRIALSTLLLFLATAMAVQGQRPLTLSTGGSFSASDSYAKIYSYHPDKDTLYVQDSVPGDFSNDVLYDGEYYYLHVGRSSGHPAGGDAIYQYEEHSFDVVDSIQPISGTNNIAVHDDHLVITRGFGAGSEYVRVYDRNDLGAGPTYAKDSISNSVNGLTLMGDSAYLGYTENDSGRIATLDLSTSTPSLDTIYEMDTLSAGIGALVNDSDDVYALSERYAGPPTYALMYAAVTQFDPSTGSYSTDTNSYGSSSPVIARNDSIWMSIDSALNVYDVATGNFPNFFPVDYTAGILDPDADRFYFQRTDYSTTGDLLITDAAGTRIDSFSTDISGTALSLADSVRTMAGVDTTICSNADLMLNGTASTDSAMWMSSGSGSFTYPDKLNTTYMPSSADTSSGSVQISLVSMDTGRFRPDTSTMVVNFKSVPVVNAGPDKSVCGTSDTASLGGSVSGAVTSNSWMTLGDGTFKDSSKSATDYYPGTNDSASGAVDLILTATNGGDCPVKDTMRVTVDQKAKATIASGSYNCSSSDTVAISANSNSGSGEWSSLGSGTFDNSTALTTSYYMSSADVSNGRVTVRFATTNSGSCEPDTATSSLVLEPSVDAGSDISTTVGSGSESLNGSVGAAADQWEWSTYGSGSFADKGMLSTSYDPSQADEDMGSVNLKLMAMNDSICPNSDVLNIDFTDTHVAKRDRGEASLQLRPVPAGKTLIVNSAEFDKAKDVDYSIIDVTGRVVREGRMSLGKEERLNVEDLHEGSYFLRVLTEDSEFVRKWMKR